MQRADMGTLDCQKQFLFRKAESLLPLQIAQTTTRNRCMGSEQAANLTEPPVLETHVEVHQNLVVGLGPRYAIHTVHGSNAPVPMHTHRSIPLIPASNQCG